MKLYKDIGLKVKIEKLAKIKGKKDFRKIIWEILEPENGNGE